MPSTYDTDRFMNRVVQSGKCWIYTGFINEKGYGCFNVGRKSIAAHRFSYSCFVGELISGMEIDHLCRNRACVNPDHLEQVTKQENIKRSKKDYCKRGHNFTPDNTYIDNRGARQCKMCLHLRRTTESYREKRRVSNQSLATNRSIA